MAWINDYLRSGPGPDWYLMFKPDHQLLNYAILADVIISVTRGSSFPEKKKWKLSMREYHHIPLSDNLTFVTPLELFSFLKISARAEKLNYQTYVHCDAGQNRSVLMVGLYRYMRTGAWDSLFLKTYDAFYVEEDSMKPSLADLSYFLERSNSVLFGKGSACSIIEQFNQW